MRAALLSLVLLFFANAEASAQPFGPGPAGDVPGQSMVPNRISGAPAPLAVPRIGGAKIFGDTVRERAHGRPYDDSYLRPRIGAGENRARRAPPAIEGRSAPSAGAAEFYARQGPAAIGGSSITRGNSQGPNRNRAIIRR